MVGLFEHAGIPCGRPTEDCDHLMRLAQRLRHPSPITLAALAAAGARSYRTDLDGGISLDSDGRSIEVKSTNPTVRARAGEPPSSQ